MRLFIAVDISDEARGAAAAHIAELRRRYLGVKVSWVRPENLHITVKFLGETPEDKIDGIKEALAAAAAAIGWGDGRVPGAQVWLDDKRLDGTTPSANTFLPLPSNSGYSHRSSRSTRPRFPSAAR